MSDNPVRVIAFCGSLRRASLNMAALRAARALQPPGMQIEFADISELPFFSEDLETEGFPLPVTALRAQVAACDALLIATPEYNYSLPAVLKNALDWLSRRDPNPSSVPLPLQEKPLAIMGASMGRTGTARAQLHLRQICVYTNMWAVNQPEVLIGEAHQKFDAQGNLIDGPTRDFIRNLLDALLSWSRRLGRPVFSAQGDEDG